MSADHSSDSGAASRDWWTEHFILGGLKELLLRELDRALAPFVFRKLKDEFGENWWARGVFPYLDSTAQQYAPRKPAAQERWFKGKDALFMLSLILKPPVWDALFKSEFGDTFGDNKSRIYTHIKDLRESRNLMEHDRFKNLTRDEMSWAIHAAELILKAFGRQESAEAVRELRRPIPILEKALQHFELAHLDSPDIDYAVSREPAVFESVTHLTEDLEEGRIGLPSSSPSSRRPDRRLVKVAGTFAPRLLLARGWWEWEADKAKSEAFLDSHWRTGLQKWLFRGLATWGPSWDPRVSKKPPVGQLVGQLASGDEANSVCVVLRGNQAEKAKKYFKQWGGSNAEWGGFEAQLTGNLSHRSIELAPLFRSRSAPLLGASHDPCIVVDDEDGHDVTARNELTTTYTGYLWQCVVPEQWAPDGKWTPDSIQSLHLDEVIFIWEHTELTDQEAVAYSLDSIKRKRAYLADRYGPLVILEKSDMIVEGKPESWLPDLVPSDLGP